MKARTWPRRLAILACILPALSLSAWAQTGQHWVATWAASPQPSHVAQGFRNQTLRMIVQTSIGGSRLRVQLSNAFGAALLTVGAAHIALHLKDSEIVPASDRALSFGGKASAIIPAGAALVSDPVSLTVAVLGDLVVSVYLPGDTGPPTMHFIGLHTTYASRQGNFTAEPRFADAATSESWYFLSRVQVLAPASTGLIVAFGDSITDGDSSTVNANADWPSVLAARLAAAHSHYAVVDQGISGNRLLRDDVGANALARFDRDVLSQEGMKWVVILEGINDIGYGNRTRADTVTAEDLIAAHKQLIGRAHIHGVKVVGCTLTPYAGAPYYTESGDVLRQAVNKWIRTGGAYDAVVDFDALTRDPSNTKQIRRDYNISDHLHPNDAGYKAMADAIKLSIF